MDKALAVNPTHADLLTIKKDLLEILTILKFPEGSELEAGKGIGASDILDFDKVVQRRCLSSRMHKSNVHIKYYGMIIFT